MQITKDFQLLPDDRETLKRWPRRSTTPSCQTRRARIQLSLDGGRSPTETARLLHISRATVHLWHRRYRADGLEGLVDRPRSGRPTVLSRQTVERILFLTTERVPVEATHWSTRLMARYAGVTQWQVRKVLAGCRRQAASAQDLQAEPGPAVRREGHRRGRALPQPTRQRIGALGRREDADPGPRPDPSVTGHPIIPPVVTENSSPR